jgi:hypothetical protein
VFLSIARRRRLAIDKGMISKKKKVFKNEHVEIGKQSSLKQKWEYPLRVQVSLFVFLIQN